MTAFALAGIIGLFATHLLRPTVPLESYWNFAPLLVAALLSQAAFGLYSTGLFDRIDELKRIVVASTVFYLGLLGCTLLYPAQGPHFRAVLFLSWLVTLIAVPGMRRGLNVLARDCTWWGCPVALIGSDLFIVRMTAILAKRSVQLPLVPVLTIAARARTTVGLDMENLGPLLRRVNPYCVLFAPTERDPFTADATLTRLNASARRVLVIPDFDLLDGLQVTARDCGGRVALEVQNNLLSEGALLFKDLIDCTSALALCVLLAPAFLCIAAVIKLTSRGPAFYGHWRYGKGGRRFRAVKFRTMVQNSAELLEKYLAQNPEAREEWEQTHKLRRDPRITPIGRFLRVWSLDELPQLWNVLRGEMSLIGPRPIVEEETRRYGRVFELYKQVPPGITGLWQVSGRNNTSYEERIRLDEYYVRNWSVWLDLDILLRTVSVVLAREGAC